MSKAKKSPKKTTAPDMKLVEKTVSLDGEAATGFGDLDKVRSILFGTQSREYEKRFTRIEDQISREMDALRDQMTRRFEALEGFVKDENEALGKRLATEQQQRQEGHEALSADARRLAQLLKEHRTQLEEQIAESERTLRSKLLDQSKSLSQDIEQKADLLSSRLEQHSDELRDEKADRYSLADLFEGLSMRLREGTPGTDEEA